jgi:hypothetical protein
MVLHHVSEGRPMKNLKKSTRGTGLLTYGMLTGLIAVVALLAISSLGGSARDIMSDSADSISASLPSAVGGGEDDGDDEEETGTHGAITWATGADLDAVAGEAVDIVFSATGADSYALTTGSLPSGLSFNAGTHSITGTPAASETTSSVIFTVTASNLDGGEDREFTLTIQGHDPYIDNVVALYHFDTDFTDSVGGHDMTPFSGASIQGGGSARFGAGGARLPSNAAYAEASSPDFEPGSGDYTMECWFKQDSTYGGYSAVFGRWGAFAGPNWPSWGFFLYTNSSLAYYIWGNGTNPGIMQSAGGISTGSWHAVAITRESSTVRVYIDGTQILTYTGSLADSVNSSAWGMRVGLDAAGTNVGMVGQVDEVRITHGVARYTGGSYTVATAPFPDY